jgi:hypothetical protein
VERNRKAGQNPPKVVASIEEEEEIKTQEKQHIYNYKKENILK